MSAVDRLKTTWDASLGEVISCLDRSAGQIALVVDADDRLIGTITDGDVRRALLRGSSMEASAQSVMNPDFASLPADASRADALALMTSLRLHQVPLMNPAGQVVDVLMLDDLIASSRLRNPVVVLAGGEGKRLRPASQLVPKPLIDVGGKPMLERVLLQYVAAGLTEFYFSVGYLAEQVMEYFGDGRAWGVDIQYLVEHTPMGTAGPLSFLADRDLTLPVVVTNSDVLTGVDVGSLIRFHEEERSFATVGIRSHRTSIPYGVVRMEKSRLLAIEEKPEIEVFVSAGIYVFNPSALRQVPAGEATDMPTFLQGLVDAGHDVMGFPIHEPWMDVGTPESLMSASQSWLIGDGV